MSIPDAVKIYNMFSESQLTINDDLYDRGALRDHRGEDVMERIADLTGDEFLIDMKMTRYAFSAQVGNKKWEQPSSSDDQKRSALKVNMMAFIVDELLRLDDRTIYRWFHPSGDSTPYPVMLSPEEVEVFRVVCSKQRDNRV